MAILYKNAKKEVDKEFDQLTKAGWTPVENEDGTTYSWKNDKGDTYVGKLNPTPGRDADAGFLKQHLTREARQDRLMSEKVTAMLGRKKTPSVAAVDESKPAGKTEATVPAITRETIPARSERQLSTRNIPSVSLTPSLSNEDKTLRKSSLPPIQKTFEKITDVIPTDNESDTTNPYIYVDQEEYQKDNSWVTRAGSNVWGGTDIGNINMLMKGMRPSPIFSGEMVTPKVPRTRVKDGKTQVLIHNPKFKFEPQAQEDIIGQPGSKFETVAANTLTNIEGLVMPGSIRGIPGATRLVGETIKGALVGGPATSKTAQVIRSLFPNATKTANIVSKTQKAIGAGQTAIEGTSLIPKALPPSQMVSGGRELATRVFNAATRPKGFSLKPINVSPQSTLGPAFKCGGKMASKKMMPKLTPKMKGK